MGGSLLHKPRKMIRSIRGKYTLIMESIKRETEPKTSP